MANAREQAYFEFSTEEKEGETRMLERREEKRERFLQKTRDRGEGEFSWKNVWKLTRSARV